MKKILLYILLFNAVVISAQTIPSSVVKDYRHIAMLIKLNNAPQLASLVEYPLKRSNPVPNIISTKEFISYYDTLFDNEFKKKVISFNDSDIFFAEGNYGLFNGDIWIDDSGKIISINHSSDAEKQLGLKITNETKATMYPGIEPWQRNIVVCKSDKILIRVDETKEGIRYISWGKGKQISDKPDLVLNKGVEQFQGTQGGVSYTFTNGDWIYIVDEVDLCEEQADCGLFLRILHNNKMVESINCVEIK